MTSPAVPSGGPSPAERFAASRRRRTTPHLRSFAESYEFGLDPFQLEACEALEHGRGVLVAAPTGAGKTVVGEFAVSLALAAGRKCFYTTPIKALSNQKYADLVARHGADRVGLLTGDRAVNGDADVVVMTTEVLRNMLYAGSGALRGLGYVVMDEVHYLSDRFRGAVWEEVIIHLPDDVRLVSLSATVSNYEEFADWLVTVRGDTAVVVEEQRPVPLWQHVLVGSELYDLFDGRGQVEPALARRAREANRPLRDGDRAGRRGGRGWSSPGVPSRVDVLARLDREGLLPAITFVFSRAGCDAAVTQCLRAGVRLTTPEERSRVHSVVERRTADLSEADRRVLGYGQWREGLERGLAAHHAGMLPAFKEVVEELFVAGLVKAVFATETLALGINMPARSVVLEKLSKWNGETHADITPGEFTQLTGRAGRRGIDVEGHAVVLWQPGLDPASLAGLASTRTYPLRSSFRPSYNMAVNLVTSRGREAARALLESSFAQFQADRAVVGLARQVRRNLEALDGYADASRCHLGDFAEYAGLRRALSERESALARAGSAARRAAAAESLLTLRPGDVVRVPTGKRSGLAVVVDPGISASGNDASPLVVTEDRWAGRLSSADFPSPVEALTRVKVPRGFSARSPQDRRDLASTLRNTGLAVGRPPRGERTRSAAADDAELAALRRRLRAHPCHGCDEREDHARWAERWARLRKETDVLERRVESRTSTVARTFDRVVALLDELGYLAGESVTPAGEQLARVYSESDLLVVECLRDGVWESLDPPSLAACVSALVHESRRPDLSPRVPAPAVAALDETVRRWRRLAGAEERHRLSFLREPDPGFAMVAWRWASGRPLEEVLGDGDLTAGDFVRGCKQLVDLLAQVALVAEPGSAVRRNAAAAVRAVDRGVVAYTSRPE